MGFVYCFINFIIYSFIGYIVEVIYVSILEKKVLNRGFLCGPILPIYGIGATLMALLLKRYTHDIIALFVFGALIASVLEYYISYILEKAFHNRWWDYSKEKLNINGRICLNNAILFGIGSVIVVELLQPFFNNILSKINIIFLIVISVILLIILIADTIYSCLIAYNLRSRIIIVEKLKNDKLAMLPNIFENHLKEHVEKLKVYPSRLIKAFPNLSKKYQDEFDIMKKYKKNKKPKANK